MSKISEKEFEKLTSRIKKLDSIFKINSTAYSFFSTFLRWYLLGAEQVSKKGYLTQKEIENWVFNSDTNAIRALNALLKAFYIIENILDQQYFELSKESLEKGLPIKLIEKRKLMRENKKAFLNVQSFVIGCKQEFGVQFLKILELVKKNNKNITNLISKLNNECLNIRFKSIKI